MLRIKIKDSRVERQMCGDTVIEGRVEITDEAGALLASGSDYTYETQVATILMSFVDKLVERGAVEIIK